MAVISKITTQQKNKNRYNLFLDRGHGDEFWLSVDEDVLVMFHLRKGLEVNEEDLESIIYEETVRKAYNKAIHYLSFRIRSEKEVKEYLAKKEIDQGIVSVVIERLLNEKYINDKEFADAFVRTRMNLTLKGPEFIKKELMDKGINESIIIDSLKLFTIDKQIEKVTQLIEKKKKKKSNTSSRENLRKLMATMVQQGFVYDVVKSAFDQLLEKEEELENDDWEAITFQGNKAFKKYRQFTGWEKDQKIKQFLYRRGFESELIERFLLGYDEEE